MTDYYVDPDAGGNDDGTTWTHAWTTLQRAIDGTNGTQPTAGDTVYCRLSSSASESISAQIDWDGNDGTAANSLNWVGCNASGVEDGTRYVIDAGSSSCHGWHFNGMQFLYIRNFELKSSATGTYHGIIADTAGSSGSFVNVYIHDFPGHGVSMEGWLNYTSWVHCRFSSNGMCGIYRSNATDTFYGCVSDNNGDDGFNSTDRSAWYGCVAHSNTDNGWNLYNQARCINCVAHDNGQDGFTNGSWRAQYICCRATNNNAYGFANYANGPDFLLGSYAQGNTSGATSGNVLECTIKGDSTYNDMTGSDRDYGYVDSAGDDYNLRPGATLRSKALEMP